jgi:hypothetical protein
METIVLSRSKWTSPLKYTGAELVDLSLATQYAMNLQEVLTTGSIVEQKGFIRSFVSGGDNER